MSAELKELIDRVKASDLPVQQVVDEYFGLMGWSLLKDEYNRMDDDQKAALIRKLTKERNRG